MGRFDLDDDDDEIVDPIKITPELQSQAMKLLASDDLLYRVTNAVKRLGVVGEESNVLTVFLACVARSLLSPPLVIVKGATSSGKSTVPTAVTQLFDPSLVLERSGLTEKALAHGSGALAGQILLLDEHRCGKDAQQLLRLLQSEGRIAHEYTVTRGRFRETATANRFGRPVVLTTTTELKVFDDDETRYLTIWSDESPEQTLEILQARIRPRPKMDEQRLAVWRAATSLLTVLPGDFEQPPTWLEFVASRLPLGNVRLRRHWPRFLTFCCAVALCSGRRKKDLPLNITFKDYCVGHKILNPVFAATLEGIPGEEIELVRALAKLGEQQGRGVTVREIADSLGWRTAQVYKRLRAALAQKLISRDPGTHERNLKYYRGTERSVGRFLPSPRTVLENCPELGEEVIYVNPFTGEPTRIRAKKRVGGKIGGVAPSRCKHGVHQGLCAKCAGFRE
jgi:hypothetical protein